MAQENRSTLKAYFETDKKPTEAQFEDLIDSFVNRMDDSFVESLPDATTTVRGIVQQATSAEVTAATNNAKFVTPFGVKKAIDTFAGTSSSSDSGWIAPTLLNSIVNYGGAYQSARYRKLDGVVFIEGLVKGGSSGNKNIFNLPTGFRPSKRIIMSTMTSGGTKRIDVDSNGDVYGGPYQNGWTSITISFLAD